MRIALVLLAGVTLVACSKDDTKNQDKPDLSSPSLDGSASVDQAQAQASGPDLSGNTNGDGGSGSCTTVKSCSITLTGAVSGTYACGMQTALVWTSDKNQFGIAVTANSAPGTAGAPFLSFDVLEPGKPMLGSLTLGQADQSSSHLIMNSNTNIWEFTHNGGKNYGSSTLNLTCLSKTATVGSGEVYAAGGTITSTLDTVAGSTGTGTINAVVTFSTPGTP